MATEMRIDAAGLEAEVLADVERLQAWDLASQVAGLQVSVRAPRLQPVYARPGSRDGLTHPADTSSSNLALRWRLSNPKGFGFQQRRRRAAG
jgi:hypothetical protein